MHVISGKDLERYWGQHEALLAFHKLFNERDAIDEHALELSAELSLMQCDAARFF
jgi:hypothetical protein